MRSVVFALAGILSAAPLLAQEVAPQAGRYAISASEEGFIRLDTETGAMAHCDKRNGVWHCDPLADRPSAIDRRLLILAEEVAALSREIGRLAEDLDTLQARIEASAPIEPTAIPVAEGAPGRRDAPSFAEEALARLFDLVRQIKHDEDAGRG